MKRRIPSFIAGMAAMAAVGSLSVGALAAAGAMTITVDPINIQVNGEAFQPKDTEGKDVPVFSYDGTTYAPLRALAEAYGLEVGYDQEKNMATVTGNAATATPTPENTASPTDYSDWSAEEEAAYQEFKGLWEIKDLITDNSGGWHNYHAVYAGSMSKEEFLNYWNTNIDTVSKFGQRFIVELRIQTDYLLWFDYQDTCIGQAVIYPNGKAYCSIYPLN